MGNTGRGKCVILGILNIAFKYLLENISPKLGHLPTPVTGKHEGWAKHPAR